MKNVMVDLETMGTGYRAAITAIGAVIFDPWSDELGEKFYIPIDLESSVREGLRMDAGAVKFWLKQEDSARAEMTRSDAKALKPTLIAFMKWMPNKPLVWGNGSLFDNRILHEAYDVVNVHRWHYRGDRDMRTRCDLAKDLNLDMPEMHFEGTVHKADDDAVYQARVIQAINARIQVKPLG